MTTGARPPGGSQGGTITNTADLYATQLQHADTPFDPREIRLSEVGGCARKQTLRILGYTATEPTETQPSIFASGHEHEERVFHLWATRYPRLVRRQIRVRTPYGTGHIDLWVAPERLIVEVKTTTLKMHDRLPLPAHVDQVLMYLHFWGRARDAQAEIAYRLKETGEILSFAVDYDPDRVATLLRTLGAIESAVSVEEPLPIPDGYTAFAFRCAWGTGRCPFWDHCWGTDAAVAREKDVVVVTHPALAAAAERYAALRAQRHALSVEGHDLEEDQRALEAQFAEELSTHGATVLQAGPYRITGTPKAGAVSYRIKDALAAGAVDAAVLAPYRTVGKPTRTWTLKTLPAAVAAEQSA
jgi:hypothetical protein